MLPSKVAPPIDSSPGHWPWQAAGMAAAAMLACLLVGSGWQSADAPFPFVWLDVALVQFASAVPLALFVAAAIDRAAGRNLCLGLAAAALVAGVALSLLATPAAQPLAAHLQRFLPAFALALAAALGVAAIRPSRLQPSAAALVLTVAIAAFIPPLYVRARLRSDLSHLAELLHQTRLAEAQSLARNLARLDPALSFDERPVGEVAAELDRQVEAVATHALTPLPANADHEHLLARARHLAILDFTDQALAVVAVAERSGPSAAAANLRGAIHQARSEWSASLAAYEQARRFNDRESAGVDREQLLQALTGIAFCQRKLGNRRAAASVYNELLELDPTADTHFLLAQFYDDAQHASLASHHARQAMSLAPDRYAERGQKLIDQLRTTQFSCWAIGSGP